MKKETVKKLNDILDIADDIIDIDEPLEIQKAPAVEITTTDLTSD